jgi:hypothetical protein
VSNTVINSTTITPISSGGFSSISINSSATYTLQQFNILYIGSATPIVVTNLVSLY